MSRLAAAAAVLVTAFATFTIAAEPLRYPETPRRPVVDTYHGVRVVDDYRWLEDVESPEVRDWIAAQNRLTRSVLDADPQRTAIRDELRRMQGSGRASRYDFKFAGGRLFAIKRQPPANQPMLVVMDGDANVGRERVVVDPNLIDASGRTTIDWYRPSPDGRRIALSLSTRGSEIGALRVFDTTTGKALPDVIPDVQYPTGGGDAAWAPDGKGLFYTRYPDRRQRGFHQQVWFHRLGTPVARDRYVIGRGFPRIAEVAFESSDDARHLLAEVQNGDGGEHAYWLRGADGRWREIAGFTDGIKRAAFGRDGRIYALAHGGSPRGRIVALKPDGRGRLADASTLVPESEVVIEDFVATETRLYIEDLVGGPSRLRIVALDGRTIGRIDGDAVSTVRLGAHLGGDAVLYGIESPVRDFAWYRLDGSSTEGVKTGLAQPQVFAVDGGLPGVEAVRDVAVSKDGTKIPVTIVRRVGTKLDGSNPVLLTGYGGYGLSMRPRFSYRTAFWLNHGGVFVLANLRGGGEFGGAWHLAGNLTKKQTVFDDFIACAQMLVERGYTTPQRLAIEGRSNGGLLMGAVLTQQPQRFGAVAAHVGVFDALRSETSPNGAFNVTEFGTVKDEAQFRALLAYSPLHAVKDGAAYPPVLITTGTQDGRVEPWSSYKMAARLQAAAPDGPPVLLRVAGDAGHGRGTSLASRVEEDADTFTFLFARLGMRAGAK